MCAENKDKDNSRCYKIDICDNYFATRDNYCYTLHYIRNKIATPTRPDVDESETVDEVLGYYTDFDKMLWDVIRHEVDVQGRKKGIVTLKEYANMFRDFENELKDIYGNI